MRYLPVTLPSGPKQHGHVVDQMAVALEQAGDDVQTVFPGQCTEILRRGPGHRLGDFRECFAGAVIGQCLAQHDEVGMLLGGLLDQRGELSAVGVRRLRRWDGSVLTPDVPFTRRWFGFCRDVGPLDLSRCCSLQVQLDQGLGCPGRSLIDI